MYRLIVTLVLFAISVLCWSSEAGCVIRIYDVVSDTKYTIQEEFTLPVKRFGQTKHFDLPGTKYRCSLKYYGLDSGTSLSCQFDENGHNFVQSDRTVVDEVSPKNNLNFRLNGDNYVIKSLCE